MTDAMGDMGQEPSPDEMAELSALADGTLPADRRAAIERRVAASPRLQELLDRQRRALTATSALANEPVPDSLRARVAEHGASSRPRFSPSRGLGPALAAGGAVAALAAVLLLVIGQGAAGPSVADAARLATLPPSEPAPARAPGSRTKLAIGVGGVAFPDLQGPYGWRAGGARRGQVGGRDATAVYYARGSERIGYVIVGGSSLPQPEGAHRSLHGGVEYRLLRIDGRPAVTWRRGGRTCVLTGRVSAGELLTLAAWNGNGTLVY
jgi:anti-sigma factor RsiW